MARAFQKRGRPDFSVENKWDTVKIQTGWNIEPCYVIDSSLAPVQQSVQLEQLYACGR